MDYAKELKKRGASVKTLKVASSKKIILNDEVFSELIDGINFFNTTFKELYGPESKLALIQRKFHPILATNDGVEITRQLLTNNPIKNIIFKILNNIALEMNKAVGDTTKLSVLLAAFLIDKGLKLIKSGIKYKDIIFSFDWAQNNIKNF